MGKHLNLCLRIIIENNHNESISLRKVGIMSKKSHTTISREILTRWGLNKEKFFNNFNIKCRKANKAPFVCNGCYNKNQVEKQIFLLC